MHADLAGNDIGKKRIISLSVVPDERLSVFKQRSGGLFLIVKGIVLLPKIILDDMYPAAQG